MARVNIRAILTDPAQRREMMVRLIQATQAVEGISCTREQAEAAYDSVRFRTARPGAPRLPDIDIDPT